MPWYATTVDPDLIGSPPADGWVPTQVNGTAILLVPLAGAWYAVEDRCSHAGCAFSEDGELDGTTMICGCHGSEFDVTTGRVIRSPAERPIATYETRVADGRLEVELP